MTEAKDSVIGNKRGIYRSDHKVVDTTIYLRELNDTCWRHTMTRSKVH